MYKIGYTLMHVYLYEDIEETDNNYLWLGKKRSLTVLFFPIHPMESFLFCNMCIHFLLKINRYIILKHSNICLIQIKHIVYS